ncbi:hypothetical protein AGIG_G25548 [Arapaima gigas]
MEYLHLYRHSARRASQSRSSTPDWDRGVLQRDSDRQDPTVQYYGQEPHPDIFRETDCCRTHQSPTPAASQLHPEETVEDGATEATGAGPQALDLQHSACEEGSGVLEDRPLLDYPQSQGGLQQWKRRDTMPSLTPSFNVPQPSSIALGASESVALAAPVATKTKGDADSRKLKERDCGGMLQRPVDIPAPEGSSSNKDDEEPWTEEGPDAASPGVDSGDREPKKPERKDDAKTKSPQNEGAEFSFSQLPVRKQLNNGTSTVAEDDGISER